MEDTKVNSLILVLLRDVLMNNMQEVKAKVGDRATVLKMNIDKNPHYTQLYGIRSVPTLAIFKEGSLLWRKSGVTPAHEILKHLELLIP